VSQLSGFGLSVGRFIEQLYSEFGFDACYTVWCGCVNINVETRDEIFLS
jgi:hypothetical protein